MTVHGTMFAMTMMLIAMFGQSFAACACDINNCGGQCIEMNNTCIGGINCEDLRCLNGNCVQCIKDDDCEYPTYICNFPENRCVECTSDYDCGDRSIRGNIQNSHIQSRNKCDGRTFTCVECNYDYDCYSERRCGSMCGVGGVCSYGRDCTSIGMRCASNKDECVECISSRDCDNNSYCNTSTYTCQNCMVDADCRSDLNCDNKCMDGKCESPPYHEGYIDCTKTESSVCDRMEGRCVECVKDSDCMNLPEKTKCDVADGQCYECVKDSDCEDADDAEEACNNNVTHAKRCIDKHRSSIFTYPNGTNVTIIWPHKNLICEYSNVTGIANVIDKVNNNCTTANSNGGCVKSFGVYLAMLVMFFCW